MPPERDEQIRQRAYEIWEREGRPHGRDEEHWRMAVDELVGEFREARFTQPVPAARATETAKPDKPASAEPPKPAGGSGDATQPAAQSDPLGLAQPQSGAEPASRAAAKPRGGQSRKPGNGSPPRPDRTR
jgi:hypothetical protein